MAMDRRSRAATAPWDARGAMFSQAGLARPVAWASPQDLDRLRDLDQLRARHPRGRLGRPLVPVSEASPRLSPEQVEMARRALVELQAVEPQRPAFGDALGLLPRPANPGQAPA